MPPRTDGYFAGAVSGLRAGDRYGFRLDDDPKTYPDPASRAQPDGVHGLSAAVDPRAFAWNDGGWRGVARRGQVIYELHVGTFTVNGTYEAAAAELPALRDLGVTVVELMPVAEFAGNFGWGYDGVDLWAPARAYGTPDDLRRLVDQAHGLGLGVILDVVYNHLGPDGNYLKTFASDYFTARYANEWGEALNFDGPDSGPVREFFAANAGVLDRRVPLRRAEAGRDARDPRRLGRAHPGGDRPRVCAAPPAADRPSSSPNTSRRTRAWSGRPRPAVTAWTRVWNDDFHHTARVALTGRNEAYYRDYLGRPQELISALRWGYLYQGQWYRWQKKTRGTPALDVPAESFVICLENHDQVANTLRGARLPALTSPGRLRAMTALTLLAPGTPMLFQGQEYGSPRPFLYFADHGGELAGAVRKGRREFLAQFPSLASPEVEAELPDPGSPAAFLCCKLDRRDARPELLALHRDLLALRRSEAAFAQQRADRMHGAVLGEQALALRFRGDEPSGADDRVLLVNLGSDLPLSPIPEPLLAPPDGKTWHALWTSEGDPVRRRWGARSSPSTKAGCCRASRRWCCCPRRARHDGGRTHRGGASAGSGADRLARGR